MAKVKGMLLTLGFFILILIFFSFALLITNSFRFSKERVSDMIVMDKMKVLDESAQEGFRNIFDKTSGILIIKGDTISFTEELPNRNDISFKNNLSKYNKFINSSYPININLSLSNELALWIRPHNIKYYHVAFGNDVIKVKPNAWNFNKYSVRINTDRTLDATSCSGSGSSDGKLDVYAYGVGSTSCNLNSVVDFKLYDNVDALIATVNITSDNILTIDSEMQINVTTSIENLNDLGKIVDVKTDENGLSMNFSEYNFVKKVAIRVV